MKTVGVVNTSSPVTILNKIPRFYNSPPPLIGPKGQEIELESLLCSYQNLNIEGKITIRASPTIKRTDSVCNNSHNNWIPFFNFDTSKWPEGTQIIASNLYYWKDLSILEFSGVVRISMTTRARVGAEKLEGQALPFLRGLKRKIDRKTRYELTQQPSALVSFRALMFWSWILARVSLGAESNPWMTAETTTRNAGKRNRHLHEIEAKQSASHKAKV